MDRIEGLCFVVVLACALAVPSVAHAQSPGAVLDVQILGPLPPTDLEAGEKHARMRVAGTVLLTVGAVMIPTTASAWMTKGNNLCDDSCPTIHDSRVIDAGFGTAIALETVVVGAGRGLLTAGYAIGRPRVGPQSSMGTGLRAVGGVLIAISSIALPLGVAKIGASDGGVLDGIGALLLASGVPTAAAGSYYDNTKTPVTVGASPLLRGNGDPSGRAFAGMVTNVAGRF